MMYRELLEEILKVESDPRPPTEDEMLRMALLRGDAQRIMKQGES